MNNVTAKGKSGDWVDLGSDSSYTGKPKGKRRVIPKAVLRKIAHESTEGGTARCPYCNTRFAMYYIRRVRVGAFQIELVCCDCKKEHGFMNAD